MTLTFTHKTDDWECLCGNTSHSDGFFPCDETGIEVEPTLDSDWDGLFRCIRCGDHHRNFL